MRALVSNTALIGLGTITSKGLAFLLVPIATFLLTPEGFGSYDLAVSVLGLLVPIVTMQLEQAIFRFVFENPSRARIHFTPAFVLVATVALVCGGIFYIASSVWLRLDFALPLAVYFIALACYTCCIECVRGLQRLGLYSALNVFAGLLVLVGVLVFVWWLDLGVNGLLWSFAVPYFALTLYMVVTVAPLDWRSLRGRIARRRLRGMLAYSLPLVPNVIAFWIVNVSDRVLISLFLGIGANGLYAVSARVATLLSIVFGVFNVSFQQTAVGAQSDSDREIFFGRLLVRSGRFLFGVGCLVTGFSPLFFDWVFSSAFSDAYRYVPGLVFGALLLSLAQFLGNLLIAFRRTKAVGASTAVAALLNVLMNLALIPVLGVHGAVLSTIVAYFVMLVVRYRTVGLRLVTVGDAPAIVMTVAAYGVTSLLVLFSSGPGGALAAAIVGILACSALSGRVMLKLLLVRR